MELQMKEKAAPSRKVPRLAKTQGPSTVQVNPALQHQHAVAGSIQSHLSRPIKIQRQVAQPVLKAATLHQQEVQSLALQRQTVSQQMANFSHLPTGAIELAMQRQQAPTPAMPSKPQGVGDWVTVMRTQAEQVQGRQMNGREAMQYSALQRQVANTIAQNFRQDRQPAIQRYEQYGQHLATLQRSAAAPVASAALSLIPAGERNSVQRAMDKAIQREVAQQAQDAQALQLHSLQRQLAELDHEATQPVFERIQTKRGSGNPLPEAVQHHLEHGLNHDLSAVRIHDDAEADKLAKGVNAIAFTTGTDIFFQSGKFNPNTQSGLELLAHEVTHTVQQSKGQVGKGVDPDSGLESEARHMGRQLASMKPQGIKPRQKGTVSNVSAGGTKALQRKAAPSQGWTKNFSGTLGNYRVTLNLSFDGATVRGSYAYAGRQGALQLNASKVTLTPDGSMSVNLSEVDDQGKTTGHLSLTVHSNNLTGIWYGKDSASATLPVSAVELPGKTPKPQEPATPLQSPKPQDASLVALQGNIGSYGIHMTLNVNGTVVTAAYGYDSKGTGTPFSLSGSRNEQNHVTLTGEGETFTGVVGQDLKSFNGNWSASGKSLSFAVSSVSAPKQMPPLGNDAQKALNNVAQSILNVDFVKSHLTPYMQSNIPLLLKMGVRGGITNPAQMSYILATAFHETKFGSPHFARSVPLFEDSNPLKKDKQGYYRINHVTGHRINSTSLVPYFNDAYGRNKGLGNRPGTNDGYDYRGRGFVQLTGRKNYRDMTERLNAIGYTYTLNGKTYGGKDNPINLLVNPDHVGQCPELAAITIVMGMQAGSFTGASMGRYINDKKTDFYNVRSVVNGDKGTNGTLIKGYAEAFSRVLSGRTWSDLTILLTKSSG